MSRMTFEEFCNQIRNELEFEGIEISDSELQKYWEDNYIPENVISEIILREGK